MWSLEGDNRGRVALILLRYVPNDASRVLIYNILGLLFAPRFIGVFIFACTV